MDKNISILQFINALRKTDRYIEIIYMEGACYQLHLLLKELFPEAKPYINKEKNHVITEYLGKFYDITGEVSGDNYTLMIDNDVREAHKWSFHKNKVLKIKECPVCGEFIVI